MDQGRPRQQGGAHFMPQWSRPTHFSFIANFCWRFQLLVLIISEMFTSKLWWGKDKGCGELADRMAKLRGSLLNMRMIYTRETLSRCSMMTSSNGNIFRVTGNSPVPVNSPHKGQWRGALMFSLICAWINDWVNNREAGDLRRHRGHYDVNVMLWPLFSHIIPGSTAETPGSWMGRKILECSLHYDRNWTTLPIKVLATWYSIRTTFNSTIDLFHNNFSPSG